MSTRYLTNLSPLYHEVPRPTVGVVGLGYLGLTHAVALADRQFHVVVTDVLEDRRDAVRSGECPFSEPGVPEKLERYVGLERIEVAENLEEVAESCDVVFIAVGTPPQLDGSADTSAVYDVVRELTRHAQRDLLIVGKSTVPVGTCDQLVKLIESVKPAGVEVRLAWNPEFLREGRALQDALQPDRIVIGVEQMGAENLLRAVYQRFDTDCPVVVTDFATAELTKQAANSYLAMRVSFANSMAALTEQVGGDVLGLLHAVGLDPRIGLRFLQPGLGYGGGCLPKDVAALYSVAMAHGVSDDFEFLVEAGATNARRIDRAGWMAERLTDRVREAPALGTGSSSLDGARVAVLGATFKPGTDDVRESPALALADALAYAGAQVRVYDPEGTENAKAAMPHLTHAPTLAQAAAGADLVILATEWEEFSLMSPRELDGVVAHRNILDCRLVLDGSEWADAGWTYARLGAPLGEMA